MTITAPDETVRPEPERARIEQLTDAVRRRAWTIGLAGLTLWLASATILSLHAHGMGFRDPTQFSMAACWLIGAGCLGNPNIAMRALGNRLTPTASLMVAAVCTGIAILLTVLFWTGAMHPPPLIATFSVILPEAAAIQAYNTVEGEMHARRREQRSYRRGRLDAFGEMFRQGRTTIAGLDHLESMTAPELETLADAVADLIAEKHAEMRPVRLLHAVPARRSAARTDLA